MRVVIPLFALIANLGLATHSAFPQESESAQPQLSAEQQAIHANAKAFVAGFNKADAKAIAALFAENGQMSVDGESVAEGREAIEKAYANFFAENPEATISVTIDSIKQMGPNLAIEKGSSSITSAELPVDDAYTLVHTRQNQQWLIVTADVIQRPVLPEFDWKQELSMLVGSWVAEKEDWQLKTTFEWVAGGNFLKRSFELTRGDQQQSTGIQVIGWDPLEGSITSWIFGSDGGHGRGWWRRDEDLWVIDTEGTTADGEIIRATNIFTMLGENELRWQSTHRSIDDVLLEDTDSVRVRRAPNQQ
jgi:uncharacterized protein (TIGR02246 family)